jgi:ParB-like chromosome segregation protein Spo0J
MNAPTTQAAFTTGSAISPETKPSEYSFHKLSNIFPLLEGEKLLAFKKDIQENGQREPIALYNGQILDGRNRYKACKGLGIEPKFIRLPPDTDPVKYIVSANLHRRHLKESQRAMVAAKIADLKLGDNQHSQKEGLSIETASAMLNASKGTAIRCKKVLNDGVPDLAALVERGTLPASVAEKVADFPKEKQQKLVEGPVKNIKLAVKSSPEASDKLDGVENAYIEKLQALKGKNLENAEAAVANLVKRLQDLGFKVSMKK